MGITIDFDDFARLLVLRGSQYSVFSQPRWSMMMIELEKDRLVPLEVRPSSDDVTIHTQKIITIRMCLFLTEEIKNPSQIR